MHDRGEELGRGGFVVEHIVCFKLKPETTPEQGEQMIARLRTLKGEIPSVVDLTAGKTFVPERGQGFSIGLVVRCHDKEGLAAYAAHPKHQAVLPFVREMSETIMAIDYEIEA